MKKLTAIFLTIVLCMQTMGFFGVYAAEYIYPVNIQASGGTPQDVLSVLDGAADTVWQVNGDDNWICFEFPEAVRFEKIGVTWPNSAYQTYDYKISVSEDDIDYEEVVSAISKKAEGMQIIDLKKYTGKYLKIASSNSGLFGIADIDFNPVIESGSGQSTIQEAERLDGVEDLPESVLGTKYEDAVRLLSAIGIIEDANGLSLDTLISRADFVILACKAMGVNDSVAANMTPFPDVTQGHKAFNSIALAAQMNIITGYEDQKFYPDQAIQVREAAAIAVSMLGYSPMVNLNNEADLEKYANQASQLKLFQSVSQGYRDQMTTANAIQLLYNVLHTAVLDVNFTKQANISLEQEELFMKKYLYLEYGKGQIIATPVSGTASGGKIVDSIMLRDKEGNEIQLSVNEKDFSSMLGYGGTYYYYDDGTEDAYMVAFLPGNATKLTIKTEDLQGVLVMGNEIQISYTNSQDRTARVRVDLDAITLYNHKRTSGLNVADFNIEDGEIIIIENDSSTYKDVVKLFAYETMVVKVAYPYKNRIDGKYQSYALLDLDERTAGVDYHIYLQGVPATIADLQPNDVLTITKSKTDEPYYRIEGERKSVEGQVTRLNKDYKEIGISSLIYPYVPSFQTGQMIKAGDRGVFYIDKFGRVAGADLTISGNAYGILMRVYEDDTNDGYAAQIFTAMGTIDRIQFMDKVKINGESKSSDTITSEIGTDRQLVKFVLNSDGQIRALDTAKLGGAIFAESSSIPTPNGKDLVEISTEKSRRYRKAAGVFGTVGSAQVEGYQEFLVNESTIIFEVPNPDSDGYIDNTYYQVKDISKMQDNQDYVVSAYSVKSGAYADFLVIKVDSGKKDGVAVGNTSYPLYITSIEETLNQDDEITYTITGLERGAEVTYTTANAEVIENVWYGANRNPVSNTLRKEKLLAGDVVQITKDDNGFVDSCTVVFAGSDPKDNDDYSGMNPPTQTKNQGFNFANQKIFGKVRLVDGDVIIVEVQNYDKTKTLYLPIDMSKSIVQSMDVISSVYTTGVAYSAKANGKVVTPAEIAVGDEVFIRAQGGNNREVTVYTWDIRGTIIEPPTPSPTPTPTPGTPTPTPTPGTTPDVPQDGVYLHENFNDGVNMIEEKINSLTQDGWEFQTGVNPANLISMRNDLNSTYQVMQIYRANPQNDQAQMDVPTYVKMPIGAGANKVTVQFTATVEPNATVKNINIVNGDGTTVANVVFGTKAQAIVSSMGKIIISGYPGKAYNTFKLEIDKTTSTVDVYVDGTLILDNEPLLAAVGSTIAFAEIRMSGKEFGNIRLDEIMAYDTEQNNAG